MGCIWSVLFIVIAYYVISAMIRVTSRSGSGLDQMICYGALICFVIIMILGVRKMYKNGQEVAAERQQWKNTCVFADVAILNRRYSPGGANDDDYEFHYYKPTYRLDLEMNSDQRAVAPNQTVLSVDVNRSTYEKLEKRDTVRIYYKPGSPLTFLLEEEI